MSFISKPSTLSVVPNREIPSSRLALPSIDGKSSPRLPVVSPTASGKHSDSSGTPAALAQLLGGSPRRGRRKSVGRSTENSDLPEVSDERSPVAAVKELQKHRERRRSSITFNIDDGVSDASPPSPPVSTQMSGRSMKSMTLDDEATSSTMVHYVKKKKARSVASCSAADLAKSREGKDAKAEKDKAEKAREKGEKGEKSTSAKKGGGGFFGILGGSSRTERIEQASDRVRKIDKSSPVLVHAASPTRRGSVDDGQQEGLGDWTLAIEEPEAEPDMESWQLEERKLQAALERVRMGLSAIEVDPTEEQKREESQLLKDLQEKNYTDREALAYCFVKKLGSLRNAWKYFATRQGEKFTKVTWETALLVLHLHVVILTGRNKNEIFQEMSEEDQIVTKDSWDTYFAGIHLDGVAPCPQTSLSAKEETTSVSLRKRPAASAEQNQKQDVDNEAAPKAAALPEAPVSPRRGSSIKAVATAVAVAVKPEEDPPPSPAKSRKADRRRSSTRRLGSEISEKFDTTGSVEQPVEDDEVFLERIDKVLKNISPDSEVFNEPMSRQQKAMLMAKARERNLSAAAWKQGVLVLQEDKLSKKLREDVSSLSCGLSPVHVPKSLEQFAGVIAEEEGVILTHRKSVDDDTIALEMLKESGSNAELQRAAEDFLDSLADGEIRSLALPATSRFRAAVVKAAKDRGLPSATTADGHLQIGNLHPFMQNVDCIIDKLEENQEHDFGSDLHLLQLQLVREKSVKAGLKMTEDQETIKIRRMAALMLDQKGSLEEQRMLTEAAFKKYATGRLGHQIFLRRSDLNQLFVDSPLAEGARLEDFKGRIGQVYDDTLQLQLDVLGQNYGLSKEYFQVFLTKASNELSWRPKTEVLEAFIEETAGKAEQSTLLT